MHRKHFMIECFPAFCRRQCDFPVYRQENKYKNMYINIIIDMNPSGRILNRFSRDMGVLDEMMPRVMMDAIQ